MKQKRKKIISLLFMAVGIAFAILTAISVPLPTDRISFVMILYFESIAVGMTIIGFLSYKKSINSEFGVEIFK